MNEQRVFDLKNLCIRKWRVENPDGYFGQAQWGSKYDATCHICRLAGFGSIEEADRFFANLDAERTKAMIDEAQEIEQQRRTDYMSKTPEDQAAEQEYVREQLYEGKQFTDVTLESPGIGMKMIIAIAVVVGGIMLLIGARK